MANMSAETEATRLVAAPVKGAGEDEELPPALLEAEGAVPEGVGLFDTVGDGATNDVGCSVALSVEITLVAVVEAGAAVVEAASAVFEA